MGLGNDLKSGQRGPGVLALQRALVALGHPLREDGIFGPATLAAAREHLQTRTDGTLPAWLATGILADAAVRDVRAKPARKPDARPSRPRSRRKSAPASEHGITTVGAWCGRSTLAHPRRDVAFAREHGIDRLDVIVNDHSRSRTPRRFTIRQRDAILRLAEEVHRAEIELHLMSWIMPHARYIEGAAELLVPLCQETEARSLQWDAEEPWTQARDRMTYTGAAELIEAAFSDLPCAMGANGIGYTPVRKFGPLARICDYLVPQAYATATSGIPPEVAPKKFFRRWQQKFDRPLVMGLAAYRQRGIAHHTPRTAMTAAIEATAATGVDTVIYWSLGAIRRSSTVAEVIAGIRGDRPALQA